MIQEKNTPMTVMIVEVKKNEIYNPTSSVWERQESDFGRHLFVQISSTVQHFIFILKEKFSSNIFLSFNVLHCTLF